MTFVPHPYVITFWERSRTERRVTALLGETPPTPQVSAGDWEVMPLPKRSAVTVWRGRQNLMRIAIPIILGDAAGPPVLTENLPLLKAWRPDDDDTEPPVIKYTSAGDAVPYKRLPWVVDVIEWGDAVGDAHGSRVLQKLTVTLLEYRPDEKLQVEHARQAKRRTRIHVVKSGETLVTIGKALNVAWRVIGDAQHPPIRDPRHVRVGQRLLIPA